MQWKMQYFIGEKCKEWWHIKAKTNIKCFSKVLGHYTFPEQLQSALAQILQAFVLERWTPFLQKIFLNWCFCFFVCFFLLRRYHQLGIWITSLSNTSNQSVSPQDLWMKMLSSGKRLHPSGMKCSLCDKGEHSEELDIDLPWLSRSRPKIS